VQSARWFGRERKLFAAGDAPRAVEKKFEIHLRGVRFPRAAHPSIENAQPAATGRIVDEQSEELTSAIALLLL
jgi:hypothetical protein